LKNAIERILVRAFPNELNFEPNGS